MLFFSWWCSFFGLFWPPISHIPQNVLTNSVSYRQYANILFLKLLKALFLIHDKRNILNG